MLTRKPSQATLMKAAVQHVPNLTATQIAAAELIAKKRGNSPTFNQIADQVGVSARTLARWRLLSPEFQQYVKDRVLGELVCQLPELMEVLYKKAIKTGSSRHLELSFQLLGMLQTQVVVQPPMIERRSNADIEAEILELTAELDELDFKENYNIREDVSDE